MTRFSKSSETATILNRVKEGYLIWLAVMPHIPKNSRYILGARIENKFIDLLELSYTAYFIEKEKKLGKIAESIFVLDVLKFLISLAWEAKLISHSHYEKLARTLEEIGKMLWGWKKSIESSRR